MVTHGAGSGPADTKNNSVGTTQRRLTLGSTDMPGRWSRILEDTFNAVECAPARTDKARAKSNALLIQKDKVE